ncbi:MAG: hypothetical protein EPN23_07305 [Verrucomicrobia bacterium]|nr:MAG: hypothetical protein EPN23_07305 [Verrucomicrobiota bacterium]
MKSFLLAICAAPLIAATATTITPLEPELNFDDIGQVQSGYILRGVTNSFETGVEGFRDEATGAVALPSTTSGNRSACFMHPPHKKGPGIVFQAFTLQLPKTPAGTIEGCTMMQHGTEKSDGVTYRVAINGRTAWEEHRNGSTEQPFRVDLAPWAGETVAIRFEVTPGPQNNTVCDQTLWIGRKLVLPGLQTQTTFRAPPPLDLRKLSAKQNKSWAPLSGFNGKTSAQLAGHTATLSYHGADGELAYTWNMDAATPAAPFGAFRLHAQMMGDQNIEIPLVLGANITWTQPVAPLTMRARKLFWSDAVECIQIFTNASGAQAALQTTARLEQKSLVLEMTCDQPWIKELNPGHWGALLRHRVPMPYCEHDVYFLPLENLFVSSFPDWIASGASQFREDKAVYEPLTDGARHGLRERFIFTAAWHVDETLANIPNPPSPWRAEMGRRIVLDIWNGSAFDASAQSPDTLADYDIRNDLIIFHSWQRDGYDNGLPAHFPARAQQGGEPAMQRLAKTAQRLGHQFALHENYVDYYPNYEHFTTNDLALQSDGKPEKSWFNKGTQLQSFAIKPSVMLRLAGEQSPEIHRRYGTTAGYLDVHSCVPPWFHLDHQAGVPGAGQIQSVWDAHRKLWQYERDVHSGPITGEGNRHWLWSGWLDGVEAQFGTGWPERDGMNAPLAVDFDLLRIHPLQINHGQGYYERWYGKTPPWGGGMPMVARDQYRMQEIVYGHIGFLSQGLWREPGAAWLEQHLMTPVTSRHADQRVSDIRYFVNGQWADATAAAKARDFNRVRITYANGLTITANNAAEDFAAAGQTLPQFGWFATNTDFAAGTVWREGVIVDFVNAPELRLANARRARDWQSGLPICPRVENFQALEKRRIQFSYVWKVGTPMPGGFRSFVHFDVPTNNYSGWQTIFLQDHALKTPTATWTNGMEVLDGPHELRLPEHIADGHYTWWIGLWNGHESFPLADADDNSNRIRLGDLVVADGGKTFRFEPWQRPGLSRAEWFRQHLNTAEKVIDFGFCKTDGGVVFKRDGQPWTTWTYPAKRDFHLEVEP